MDNPFPLILDRLGLSKRPYQIHLKGGLIVELRPGAGDRFGFYEVMIRGDYTQFGQTILPGDTVIDVGANIGCFSLLASKMVGPTGRVIAIEPEESTFHQLARNIALNHADNIQAHRLALGGQEGSVTLHCSEQSSLFSSVIPSKGAASGKDTTQLVKMTTLNKLLSDSQVQRCNYLKVDCEGAEYDIFGAMADATAASIDQISVEVHRIPEREPSEIKAVLMRHAFRQVSSNHVFYFRR
jgi:FkbM family methyltransferase